MRGENSMVMKRVATLFGSPPHAWGKYNSTSKWETRTRFTPTCVGKIETELVTRLIDSVHPHMRGENRNILYWAPKSHGSPPHAWGKLQGE